MQRVWRTFSTSGVSFLIAANVGTDGEQDADPTLSGLFQKSREGSARLFNRTPQARALPVAETRVSAACG